MHSNYGLLTSLYAPQCTALPAEDFGSLAQEHHTSSMTTVNFTGAYQAPDMLPVIQL